MLEAVLWSVVICLFSMVLIKKFFKTGSKCPPFPEAPVPADILKRPSRLADIPRRADVIIVGSGPSGLALGVFLSRRGKRVVIFEQHDRAGGGLHTFEEKGFEFDTGFHYGGEMGPTKELRLIVDALTGKEVEFASLEDCPVHPGVYDKVVFSDDRSIDFTVPAGRQNWLRKLKDKFPGQEAQIDAYAKDMKGSGAGSLPSYIWRSFTSKLVRDALRGIMAAPMQKFSYRTAEEGFAALKITGALKSVLSYISMGCTGVLPSSLQYSLVTGLHNHFAEGAAYPVGGPSRIAAAMVRQIEKRGGRVFVRAAVDSLEMSEDGMVVTGVRLKKGNTLVQAPVVVSSVGLRVTFDKLVPSTAPCVAPMKEKIKALPPTHGHFFLFVGLKGTTMELQLPRRNLWVLPSTDVEKSMNAFHEDSAAPFGYAGIAFPSAKDPSYHDRHPDTSVAVMLVGDVPYEWVEAWNDKKVRHRGADYDALKRGFEERMLAMLLEHFPQLEDKILFTELGTPLDNNFYLGKTRGESTGFVSQSRRQKPTSSGCSPNQMSLTSRKAYTLLVKTSHAMGSLLLLLVHLWLLRLLKGHSIGWSWCPFYGKFFCDAACCMRGSLALQLLSRR